MFNFQDIYHIGIRVPNLSRAMEEMGSSSLLHGQSPFKQKHNQFGLRKRDNGIFLSNLCTLAKGHNILNSLKDLPIQSGMDDKIQVSITSAFGWMTSPTKLNNSLRMAGRYWHHPFRLNKAMEVTRTLLLIAE